MRLIQCLRGPTSPSGMVLRAAPSGLPNSRNTSSGVSRGMLPTRRAACFIRARSRLRGDRSSAFAGGKPNSGLTFAQASSDQPGEAVGEALGVAWPLAVEHPRFVVKQMRGVLLEGLVVIPQLRKRGDEAVTRVDLQNRLRRRHDA